MADIKINQLPSGTPSLDDTILGIRASGGYQALVSDVAKKIIEDYAGSSIGGASQTIKNALATLGGSNNITGANTRFSWTALTSGQDMDSIITPGMYYCNTNTIATSLLNCPTTYAFRMSVEILTTSNIIQRIWAYRRTQLDQTVEANAIEFTRTFYTSSQEFTPWERAVTQREVNAIANRGGKNLLGNIYKNNNQATKNGITYTLNSDGSITLNGTATAQTDYYLGIRTNQHIILPKGTYILTGCPEGGSTSKYYIGYNRGSSGTTLGRDIGNGVTITDNEGGQNYGVWITVARDVTVENLTFYPMIRDASIQDDTYVPYGMSNAELTTKALELKPLSVEGAYYGASAAGTKSYELESGQTYLVFVTKINTTTANSNSAFIVVPYTTEGRASITPLANNTDYVEASISSTTLILTLKANYMEVIIMKFSI